MSSAIRVENLHIDSKIKNYLFRRFINYKNKFLLICKKDKNTYIFDCKDWRIIDYKEKIEISFRSFKLVEDKYLYICGFDNVPVSNQMYRINLEEKEEWELITLNSEGPDLHKPFQYHNRFLYQNNKIFYLDLENKSWKSNYFSVLNFKCYGIFDDLAHNNILLVGNKKIYTVDLRNYIILREKEETLYNIFDDEYIESFVSGTKIFFYSYFRMNKICIIDFIENRKSIINFQGHVDYVLDCKVFDSKIHM